MLVRLFETQTPFFERNIAVLADDEVIEHGYAQQFPGLNHQFGDVDIFR